MARNVLFVCRANCDRSPRAEKLFKAMVTAVGYSIFPDKLRDYDFQITSVGTDPEGSGSEAYSGMMEHYEEIFALDEFVQTEIMERFSLSADRVHNLEISELYSGNYKALDEILFRKLAPYVHRTLQEVASDGEK